MGAGFDWQDRGRSFFFAWQNFDRLEEGLEGF